MITILNITIFFAFTLVWNSLVLSRLVNMLTNVKNSDERNIISTSIFFDNEKDILKIANYFYYILPLFVSILNFIVLKK